MPGKSRKEVFMKIRSKLILALMATALVLPLQGFAEDEGAAQQTAAKPKQVVSDPANCPMKSKIFAPTANDDRKKTVEKKMSAEEVQAPKVEYNPDAVKEMEKQD